MKFDVYKKYFAIFIFALGTFSLVLPHTASAEIINEPYKAPQLSVPVPGMEPFQDIPASKEGETMTIPWLAQYIAAGYKYFVGVAVILAIVLMMIGGFQWMTSGGNAEGVSAGKKRITHAVTGLALALGSYVILFTINPDLIKLKSINIASIKQSDVQAGKDLHDANPDKDAATDGTAVSTPGAINADCSACNGKDRVSCIWKCALDCAAKVPDKEKSKASGSYDTKYLGSLDCEHGGTRKLKDITYIGIHEGEATQGTLITWWEKKAAYIDGKGVSHPSKKYGVSSHYLIARNGTIMQVTDEKFVTYNGIYSEKGIGIDLDSRNGKCNSGAGSKEASLDCSYTPAQYASLKKLINEIMTRTSVVFDDAHIIGHCEVNSTGGHFDPRNFDWSKIGLTNANHKAGICAYVPGFPSGSADGNKSKK